MPLSDKELVSIVDAEFESAMGVDGGEISIERARAWDYYLSKKPDDFTEGQSQYISSDVSDVIDGLMPSLLRIFTTADNLVNFDAYGPEDEARAEQESDYVNYVFFKQNPAFLIMYTWFFDALVQKNGIVKAWWDETEVVTTETYEGLSDTEVFELLQDEELEPIERDERIIQTVDEQTNALIENTVHDIKFRRVSKEGKVTVDNVPPEEYRISSDSRSLDPSKARMVGQERDVTRSDLIGMGFDEDIVNSLPSVNQDVHESSEEIAKYDKTDDTIGGAHDTSEELVRFRQCYIRVDYDEDGRSELRQISIAGNELLENEPADRQVFHVISPQPLPHKHFGRATSEKVMDVQDVNSVLTQQTLTNLYHTNNPSHAVWEQGIGEDTMDDLLSTRIGGIKRFARPVSESYAPMTVPFTAQSSFAMIEYMDKVKRDRTGVSADSEGLSPEALKNIQTTVLAQANDLSRMKIEAIARIFSETGIKSLMLHIHELCMKHQQKAKVVKLRNEWTQVNPQDWRTRMDMTVNIGLGIGSREQNLVHLNAIWDKQKQIIDAGGFGTLVTPQNVYNCASEFVKNANQKMPERYFTQTDQVTPPNDQNAEFQKQQAELLQRQQQLDAQKQQLDIEKTKLQHRREMADLQLKQQAQEDKFQIENEKIRTKLTELELEHNQNVPGSAV